MTQVNTEDLFKPIELPFPEIVMSLINGKTVYTEEREKLSYSKGMFILESSDNKQTVDISVFSDYILYSKEVQSLEDRIEIICNFSGVVLTSTTTFRKTYNEEFWLTIADEINAYRSEQCE